MRTLELAIEKVKEAEAKNMLKFHELARTKANVDLMAHMNGVKVNWQTGQIENEETKGPDFSTFLGGLGQE